MWVILFNCLWLNIHCVYFAMFHWFFSWLLGCLILLLCDFWSFHLSLLKHELWPVLSDLWDCPPSLISSSFLVYANEYSTKNWRKLLCTVWDNLCCSTIFHILPANYSSPDTSDSVASTERGCLGFFSNSFSLPVAWKLQGII